MENIFPFYAIKIINFPKQLLIENFYSSLIDNILRKNCGKLINHMEKKNARPLYYFTIVFHLKTVFVARFNGNILYKDTIEFLIENERKNRKICDKGINIVCNFLCFNKRD